MNTKIIMIAVIIIAIISGLFIGLNDKNYIDIPVSSNNISNDDLIIESGNEINTESNTNLSGENNLENLDESDDNNLDIVLPDSVKAVYATGWVTGTTNLRTSMINSLKENGYNAIVIDIKDEAGQLSYNSNVQTAIDIKSSKKMISNITSVIEELKENDIYVIGRIVTFKDPIFASKKTDIAYKKSDGTIWKDYAGNCWPNPYNNASWDYPIELAKEAATLGFQEIQFDYIRFPSSEGKTSTISYGFERNTKSKSDIISEFLEKAMSELEPYNVVVSADVFGITTKKDGDFENIGQDFARISSIVDVVCPMVYPSHYGYNEYKISKPDLKPYDIVNKSLSDAFVRYSNFTSGDTSVSMAKIRPYLQDFTASWLGKGNYMVYGTEAVTSQIQAIFDLGIEDFTLWDPSNKYCYSALKNITQKNIDNEISGENI